MTDTIKITWSNQTWTLHATRAAYWHERDALVVADLHIGKDATFRASGIPVPGAANTATLARLTDALNETNANNLIILGDFFHARAGVTNEIVRTLSNWRDRHADLNITLIRGNHDAHAGDPCASLDIECTNRTIYDDAIQLAHHPPKNPAVPTICGHLHPAAVLFDRVRTLRMPCFWFGESVAIWPSFGEFTGMKGIRPNPGDRIFGIADNEILELSSAIC